MIKYIFSFFFFLFLVLFQISFLIDIFNLTFLIIIFWSILEKKESNLSFFNALFGGFFLDIFSDKFIGFNITILLVLVFLIKYLLRPHIRIPYVEK